MPPWCHNGGVTRRDSGKRTQAHYSQRQAGSVFLGQKIVTSVTQDTAYRSHNNLIISVLFFVCPKLLHG